MLRTPKRLKGSHISASHRHAPQQERKAAKRLNATATAGSGNQTEKGDLAVRGVLRLEMKSTTRESFSITRDMLHKINIAASNRKEIPAIEVDFLDKDGKLLDQVAVVPTWVLDRLVKKGEGA